MLFGFASAVAAAVGARHGEVVAGVESVDIYRNRRYKYKKRRNKTSMRKEYVLK